MRSKYKKFTEKDRENYIKEFLRLKERTGISKARYAREHEIPVSTFKRWLELYDEYLNECAVVPVAGGSFIMISGGDESTISEISEYSSLSDRSTIRLRYKEAVLEMTSDKLPEVMEIMRLW